MKIQTYRLWEFCRSGAEVEGLFLLHDVRWLVSECCVADCLPLPRLSSRSPALLLHSLAWMPIISVWFGAFEAPRKPDISAYKITSKSLVSGKLNILWIDYMYIHHYSVLSECICISNIKTAAVCTPWNTSRKHSTRTQRSQPTTPLSSVTCLLNKRLWLVNIDTKQTRLLKK